MIDGYIVEDSLPNNMRTWLKPGDRVRLEEAWEGHYAVYLPDRDKPVMFTSQLEYFREAE